MLKVQQFLKSIDDPETALALLGQCFPLRINRYPDRVTIKYNSIGTDKFSTIVRECRGLILSFPDFEIMSYPFYRFSMSVRIQTFLRLKSILMNMISLKNLMER